MRMRLIATVASGLLVALSATQAMAQACSTVVPTCKVTTATYNGDLGGYVGADAKCAAEFAGYRFARDPASVLLAVDGAARDAAPEAWLNFELGKETVFQHNDATYGTAVSYISPNCGDWKKNHTTDTLAPQIYQGIPNCYITSRVYMGSAGRPVKSHPTTGSALYGGVWPVRTTGPSATGGVWAILNANGYNNVGGGACNLTLPSPQFNTACDEVHPLWCCNF